MDYDFILQQQRQMDQPNEASTSQNTTDDNAEQINSISSQSGTATTSNNMDVDMDDVHHEEENDDDLYSFRSVTNSSDSDSDSDHDAREVEMHAVVDDPPLLDRLTTTATPAPVPTSQRANRRARVEDDEDDERDRRHPFERINTPLDSASSSSSTSRNSSNPPPSGSRRTRTPLDHLPFPFNLAFGPPPASGSQNSSSNNNNNNNNNDNGSGNNSNPRPTLPPFFTGGIAISIDLDAGGQPVNTTIGPDLPQSQGQQQQGDAGGPRLGDLPSFGDAQSFAEFISNPTFLSDLFGIEPDVDDPQRADRLIDGLEDVPIGLVKRLERVGGMTGANGNELSGGDSGCAVCWEKLLDEEALEKGREHPKIVSLPCAHVFHADCLRPWFSRPKQTTCPTCRFNIDPENLTFVSYRQRRRAQERAEAAGSTSTSTPPQAAASTSANTGSDAPSAPASSSSAASTSEEARGRMGPPPVPGQASSYVPPLRRPSSEPPTNRRPHPAFLGDGVQSFTVPGGHVVIVNHPIGILGDAQGRPSASNSASLNENIGGNSNNGDNNGSTSNNSGDDSNDNNNNAGVPQAHSPPPPPGGAGMHGPIPRTTLPGGGELPPGVVAFDFHLPFPLPFLPPPRPQQPQQAQHQQESQQQQPQPIRVPPMGFAGVNFGNRGPTTRFADLMRMFHADVGGNHTGENNAATSSTNANPEAAGAGAANASTPPQATANGTTTPPTADATTTPPPAPASDESVSSRQGSPAASEGGDRDEVDNATANFLRSFANALNNPSFLLRLLMSAAAAGTVPLGGMPMPRGNGRNGEENNGPKKEWTPPPAPGPTLRQRVERREREAGLRCYDMSCGVGPSDEEPFVALTEAVKRQFSIRARDTGNGSDGKEEGSGDEKERAGAAVCQHTFHSSCLVSAERVASRGADALVGERGVEVSCPVCRGVGVVSKGDWEEGVDNLE